jgi:hypothetical protein
MSTDWVVTAATERFQLDAANQAELVFTVTNPGPSADRVVLEIVPGERADRAWFGVQEPQRLLPSGTSASFLVRVRVPMGVPPGGYALWARAYSADVAPEEQSRSSGRVVFDVPARAAPPPRPLPPAPFPPPPRKPRRLWPFVVAGAVLLVFVICCCWWVVTGPNH